MQLLGKLIKAGIQVGAVANENILSPHRQQRRLLRRLLRQASETELGVKYDFDAILRAPKLIPAFQQQVPLHDYDRIYDQWWSRAREDKADVSWPGSIPWFALSSGTSNAASKYIPVTEAMIKAMEKGTRRMFCDLAHFKLQPDLFLRQMLMVGSCTALTTEAEHKVGDMSGILGLNRPFWMKNYYRPNKKVTDLPDWKIRIERIAEAAPQWDIGFIVGNPAWVQLIFERIIERYHLKHIHEIWPNFSFYVHGGIFFEPYRNTFEQLLGRKVTYMDSYLASEGFIGYQSRPDSRDLKLLTNCGIFYEFIPFNEQNFDENGNMRPDPKVMTLKEVNIKEDYALLMTTCSGAWRYLLGDTIRFTDLDNVEFKVTGRVKHFLSVVGEHLSVDNLNSAIQFADTQMDTGVKEFAVAAVPHGTHWAHHWYVGTEHSHADPKRFAALLDAHLQEINDDYAVERRYALQQVEVEFLPHEVFYNWLEKHGKLNGQAKVPRVLKGSVQGDWENYLQQTLKTS